jgi:hypothetical protein
MVHGLTGQLGGALAIQSKLQVGTVIEFWLPVSTEAALRQDAAQPDLKPSATGLALLVDDEEVVRASTADMLIELGYDVAEASSAEEAIGLIKGGDAAGRGHHGSSDARNDWNGCRSQAAENRDSSARADYLRIC